MDGEKPTGSTHLHLVPEGSEAVQQRSNICHGSSPPAYQSHLGSKTLKYKSQRDDECQVEVGSYQETEKAMVSKAAVDTRQTWYCT
jgi:hypothetical protein